MDWGLKIFLAYLLGSVSGSLLLGKLKHVDIRQLGSGNAGGTNALRTQGFWFALGVVIVDVGKGYLSAALIPGLFGSPPSQRLALLCGFAAVLGHCYPLWHGFRGGKGAATAVGALVAIQAVLVLPMLATWAIILVATGFVGLGTVLAGLSLIPSVWWTGGSSDLMTFAVVLALFMTFTHRSNFANMAKGTEGRFEKAWLPNWFK